MPLPMVSNWLRRAALLAPLFALSLLPPGVLQAQFNGDFTIQKHTLDAENFLDWKAYQAPYPWRYEHYTAPNFIRGSVGSLSKKRFYQFNEIRLEKDIGRYFTVRYFQREDSFFRDDPVYREIDLRFGDGVYGSIVGFPQADKTRSAQGFAVAYGEPTDWNFVRLSRIKQFLLFNVEHIGRELFSPEPVFYRLEFRHFWDERLFLQVEARREEFTTLISPDDHKRETYEGGKLDLVLDYHFAGNWLVGLNYNGNRERRERLPFSAPAGFEEAEQTLRWGWLDLYGAVTLESGDVLEFGAFRGLFENTILATQAAEDFDHHLTTDALYIFWTHPTSDWFQWVYSFQMGAADRRLFDGAVPAGVEDEETLELKAGVGIVMHEERSYRFFFNTTWDLDLFGKRQWDGGNVQLQFFF